MKFQPSVALAVALLFAGQTEAISLEKLQTWVSKFDIVDVDFETPFKDPNSPHSLSFTAAGEDVTLDFKVSRGLFTSNAVGIPDGISKSLLTGTVRGQETDPQSYTTLTLWDDGVTGRFSRENKDGLHELSHLDKLDNTRSTVIYKDADIIGKPGAGEAPAGLVARSLARRLRKRQAVINTPATGKDCPIAIVADPTFQAKFGQDSVKQMASIMNDIQGIYLRAFNVGVPIALAVVDSNDTVGLGQNGVGTEGDIAPALDLLAASVKDQKVLTAEQQKDVCLTHMFTSREFGATLGLAFVATPQVGSEGGICQGSSATGMTTTLAADKSDLPIAAMITTVAHEIGHGFGSDHDEQIGCANQNFLMAAAVDVGGPPVSTFSDCALKLIGEVHRTKATCFKARQ